MKLVHPALKVTSTNCSHRADETVNIWSHILGALVFTSLAACVLTEIPARYHAATAADVVVCSTYFAGVAVCFALSTAFHTLMAHSEAVYLLNMKLDFQGVLVLMWAATVPLVYYSFPCEPSLRAAYWGLISVLAAACSAVTFLPRFSAPHLGPYRAVLFGAFGVGSFALPIAHGVLVHGLDEEWERVGLGWVLWTVVCDGVGVIVYGLKVSLQNPLLLDLSTTFRDWKVSFSKGGVLLLTLCPKSSRRGGSLGALISSGRAIN